MDSTAIKLEPDNSAAESVPVILTEIDIDYPFIKKKYSEFVLENNSGEVSTTEHSYLGGITIKAEPGTKEVCEISFSETGIELPDIKKEDSEHSQSIIPTAGSLKGEYVPFKVEPRSRDEDGGGFPHMEIDIDLLDVKKESLKRFQILTQPTDLLTDLKTHPLEKSFSCPHCNYSCFYKSQLKLHLRNHTGVNLFPCSDCKYSCSRKGDLTRHILTHRVEKLFSCSDCSYSCSRKSNLRRHMLTHGGEKPFSCPDCSYSCTQKRHLMGHMINHGVEKPFSCSDCKCSFSRKGDLVRHMLTHSGEKPYSCPDCSYACTRKGHLTTHMRTHCGEKPFSCSDCSYTCFQRRTLKTHVLTHNG